MPPSPHSTDPIKVFVSYTHDSAVHSQRVLTLANGLRAAGFDCDIDQYHVNQRWPTWMEARIQWADYVVVICTATYLRRWKAEEKPGVGLGAQWESLLAKQALYESPHVNDKFVPVVFERADLPYIPTPLRDVTRIVLADGMDRLVSRLLNLPPAEKPPIRVSLSPVALAEGFFGEPNRPAPALTAAFEPESIGLRDEEEPLFSNLFPVVTPTMINTAKIIRKRGASPFPQQVAAAWSHVGGRGREPVGYWFEDGVLYTFEDLTGPVWQELYHRKVLQPLPPKPTQAWAQSTVFADQARFIKLLNRSLEQHCHNCESAYRLAYTKEMKCFLFQAVAGQRIGHLRTKALKVEASRMVFRAISDTRSDDKDAIQHWQHEAFRHRFHRFGETWYLVVTPFWAFTGDGMGSPSRWQKTSSANMRKPEKNRAVLGHVMFWASILCHDADWFRPRAAFRLNRPEQIMVRPSIRDSDWVRITKDTERQDLEGDLGTLL